MFDIVFRGGVADLRRTPARIIDEAPKRTSIATSRRTTTCPTAPLPLLLVPPLAAPRSCFDLRRGCSLAEHMLQAGHRTYMVEYGHIAFSDRDLGLEHWVDDIVPNAIRRVSEDNGGSPVQVLGWCLGGIMSLLALAADPELPVESVAMVASPFDFTQVRMFAPIRGVANVTNGMLGTALYRLLGGAPAPLVRRGFQLSSIDKYLTKPLAVLSHLDDRDFLAQIEAVDAFIANMHAYPGRTMGQLYHQFFRVNDLADGRLDLGDHEIDLASVRVPVLSIAGATDALAPRAGGPPRGRAAARRAGGADRDLPGRPPGRAHGPLGQAHHLAAPGRVLRRAAARGRAPPARRGVAAGRRIAPVRGALATLAACASPAPRSSAPCSPPCPRWRRTRSRSRRTAGADDRPGRQGRRRRPQRADAGAGRGRAHRGPAGAAGEGLRARRVRHPLHLTMAQAKLKFDAHATAKHALATTPAPPPAGGGASAGVDVPLVLSHAHLAVRAFVAACRQARLPRASQRAAADHACAG